jgi:lactosylceramide 4-alpha-galactosyltransferase
MARRLIQALVVLSLLLVTGHIAYSTNFLSGGALLRLTRLVAAAITSRSPRPTPRPPRPCLPRVYWVLTSGGLHLVNRVAMESVFLHNPSACITLYLRRGANSQEQEQVLAFTDRLRGDDLRVTVIKYTFRRLFSDTLLHVRPTIRAATHQRFLRNLPSYERGQFWTYSHESNFVRLLVILRYGGIYLDSDIILTKPLPHLRNAIAHEMPQGTPGGEKVNNNVLIFDRGHRFLVEYLEAMMNRYNPSVYHANGPDLLTEVYQHSRNKQNLTVLPGKSFQPIHLNGIIDIVFKMQLNSRDCIEKRCANMYRTAMGNGTYGVHLNNRVSREFSLRPGTLAHAILRYRVGTQDDVL